MSNRQGQPLGKEKAAMCSLLRRTTVIILLTIFLAPGLLEARSSAWLRADEGNPAPGAGFFKVAWSLLASLWEDYAPPVVGGVQKNGGISDPSGGGVNGPTTAGGDEGDNGGISDPSGKP